MRLMRPDRGCARPWPREEDPPPPNEKIEDALREYDGRDE